MPDALPSAKANYSEPEHRALTPGTPFKTSHKDTPSLPAEAWTNGTRVMSPRFGRGVITGSSGSGDMLTYTIRFECGEKRIVAKFGMLETESLRF